MFFVNVAKIILNIRGCKIILLFRGMGTAFQRQHIENAEDQTSLALHSGISIGGI